MKHIHIHSVNHRSFLAPLQKKKKKNKTNKQKKAHHHHHQKHKNSSDLNCPFGLTGGHVFLNSPISSSIVVRRPPWEQKILGSNPACAEIYSGSSHTSDFKVGTPVATLPGAWRYRVSAGTGRPGVSILWLGEVERLICNFCLSVLTYLCPSLPVEHRPSTTPRHRTLFWAALVIPDQLVPWCFTGLLLGR